MKIKSLLKHNLMRAAMTLALILACAAAWAQTKQSVTYIDENGQTQTVNATVLTGNESSLGSDGTTTWYVVNSNITHSGRINYRGNVNIILADGCTMTTSNDSGDGIHGYSNSTLTIYGQTLGTGTLEATSGSGEAGGVAIYSSSSGSSGGDIIINGGTVTATATSAGANCINAGSVTINGGTVTATATGSSSQGINAGSVTINGGTVTASGTSTGIKANRDSGTITLGWTNTTDCIHASSYSGTVKIADGKALKNGGTVYYGTLTAAQKSAIANVTLQPATQAEFIAAALPQTGTNEYTIYDSVGWNALCDALQDNDTWNRFSGKTVKLGADITVTRMAGSSHCDFCGTFDGQGHTLTVNIHSDNEHEYTAPFSYISEDTPTGGSEVSHPAIRNLNVAGTVTATKNYAGGIVGAFWGTLTIENCSSSVTINTNNKHAAGFIGYAAGNATITNCLSSVTINSSVSGDGTHAGFIGGSHSGTTFTIEGCAFTGKLLTSNGTNRCAGFVGYNSGTLTISNSLFAPTEVTIGTTSSATFARNGATITNCYYTTDFNDGEHFTAQGKQARSISGGDNVTVENAGTATTYSTSGITSYGTGILYDNVLYAGNGDVVSLTLSNSIGSDAPDGYKYAYSTNAGTLDGSTLTMPDANVIVSAALRSTGRPVDGIGYYINNGNAFTEAIALDGTESSLGKSGWDTWYFVGTDISHSGYILCYGNVNIILADGKTMTITSSDDIGIYVNGSLTIYGQDYITGTLNVNSNYTGIYSYSGSGNITISGGTVNATGNNPGGIYSIGDITISDSRVTATGGSYGIRSNGNITIGCAYASDFIYASSYVVGSEGTLNIADGKAFIDEAGQTYRGTIAKVNGAYPIDGKRLYPDCVAMKQVEGYDNGDGGWVFIASPVGDIAPSEVHNLIATTEEDYDLYRFNQSDANGNEWQNWKATTTENHPDFTSLVNGQGYLYATKEDRTLVFSGEYPSGTYPVEVSLDYDPDADLAGWNLVGNPFEVEAYVDRPFYKMNDEGTGIVPVVNDFNSYTPITIPSCTGIMVHTTADEVTQGTNKVTFSTTAPAQQTTNKGSLQIALSQVTSSLRGTKQSSTLDNAIISFNEGSKLSKFYFGTQNANIYIPQDNEEYAIAFSESQGEMPLNFKAKENGTYTLTVSTTLNSQLSTLNFNYLHLIDNLTGADVDLLTSPNYTFTAKKTDYESRFKLVFSICEDANGDNEAFAFISNGNIIVNGEGTLQVFDVLGHQLVTKQLPTLNSKLSTLNYKSGVYVLRLINGEKVRTQKMVIE